MGLMAYRLDVGTGGKPLRSVSLHPTWPTTVIVNCFHATPWLVDLMGGNELGSTIDVGGTRRGTTSSSPRYYATEALPPRPLSWSSLPPRPRPRPSTMTTIEATANDGDDDDHHHHHDHHQHHHHLRVTEGVTGRTGRNRDPSQSQIAATAANAANTTNAATTTNNTNNTTRGVGHHDSHLPKGVAVYSPDGQWVAVGGQDGTVGIAPVTWGGAAVERKRANVEEKGEEKEKEEEKDEEEEEEEEETLTKRRSGGGRGGRISYDAMGERLPLAVVDVVYLDTAPLEVMGQGGGGGGGRSAYTPTDPPHPPSSGRTSMTASSSRNKDR